MLNIKVLNNISPLGLEKFSKETYSVSKSDENPDAILVRSAKMHDMEIGSKLKAIGRAGAGVNNIPLDKMSEKGVVVFNTPGANANAVKELIVAGLLLGSRDIYGGMTYVQELGYMDDAGEMGKLLEKEKKRFAGTELVGRTLGVVGLGAIGSIIANLALDLGMNVIGYDPAISVEAAWQLSSRVKRMDSLEQLLAAADYVTLHVPAIPETKHLINSKSLGLMKKTAKILK